MKTTIEWVSVKDGFPEDGYSVAAAVTGRYRVDHCDPPAEISGLEFWVVLHMYFRREHPVEETGEIIENCFVDADYVPRQPLGGTTDEVVTHWTYLPTLPGTNTHHVLGDDVQPALRAVSAD
ncbi:AQJ64_40280 family protein [Actinophytocola gossypii]|uniref:Amine oxidase n=1 Tax=Actinophytocola gossypii TaxID=2812003 RepID=A0ABT2JD48_9PSEU|nr:AQJ64_40280 family protein [Actinophytocola gossypii]MCT2585801.1 hypothetical protein [Actinophytocola gossypii]